jgi:hypothetical protein
VHAIKNESVTSSELKQIDLLPLPSSLHAAPALSPAFSANASAPEQP